jgi:hypothetical protein
VLGGKNRRNLKDKLCDARNYDKRLWKLTCYLIARRKFNRRVADKLVLRKHPIYSQEVLKRKKLEMLMDWSVNKNGIQHDILEKMSMFEDYQTLDPIQEMMKVIRSNEPEIIDLAVKTLDSLIEQQITTSYRTWKEKTEKAEQGMSVMYYLRRRTDEEREQILIDYAEYDRKDACRIKRVS